MGNYIDGLVSVVIPTYKRSEKLDRAIESVLNQTYSKLELILVNDNEPNDSFTDELIKRVEKFKDDVRFRLILQERHINGAVARNVGIKAAKGEFIAFLDDDDWWKENKIEEQVRCLSLLDGTWGGVSCRIEQYDGEKLIARLPKYEDGYIYKNVLMLKCDFATGTLFLRHNALDKTGYFDENLFRHQDLQLLVNFSCKYKVIQVDQFLHCCDVSDAQNRPNVEKAIIAKKAFFDSVSNVLDTLTPNEKKIVKLMHRAELGYIKIKSGDKLGGVMDLLHLVKSPTAFGYEICKLKEKIKGRKKQKEKIKE